MVAPSISEKPQGCPPCRNMLLRGSPNQRFGGGSTDLLAYPTVHIFDNDRTFTGMGGIDRGHIKRPRVRLYPEGGNL